MISPRVSNGAPSGPGFDEHEVAVGATREQGARANAAFDVVSTVDPTGMGHVLKAAMAKSAPGVALAIGMALVPGSSSGGWIEKAAGSFGFKSFDAMGSTVVGQFAGGGSALLNFTRSGAELGVNISMVKGPAGSLSQLLSGALAAAKASGASTLTVTASMAKDSMARLLRMNGFKQEMKNGEATGRWIREFTVE